jgi:hypothetical protein
VRGVGPQVNQEQSGASADLRPDPVKQVEALRVQAMVALRRQHWVEAGRALEEGLALARGMPYPYAEGASCRSLPSCTHSGESRSPRGGGWPRRWAPTGGWPRRWAPTGGLAALKDPDPGLWLFAPGDPTLLPRTWAAAGRVSTAFRGCFRTRTLHRRLEQLGLVDVWQRATLSELWAPLRPVQRRYLGQQLRQMGALAEQAGMAVADLAFWQRQRDPEAAGCLVHDPELFWCEGHFVAVGRVPDAQP